MRRILTNIMWVIDFYFMWILYNGYKTHRYHKYMLEKYGDRYKKLFK